MQQSSALCLRGTGVAPAAQLRFGRFPSLSSSDDNAAEVESTCLAAIISLRALIEMQRFPLPFSGNASRQVRGGASNVLPIDGVNHGPLMAHRRGHWDSG